METTPAAHFVGPELGTQSSPLFLSSSGIQNALIAVEEDLGLLSRSLVSGTAALKGAYARPASCNGASDLGGCLSSIRSRVDGLALETQALERVTVEAISFEELLGHCQATFESNQRQLDRLVVHVSNFGYEAAPAKPEETSEWESYLAQDEQQASDEAVDRAAEPNYEEDEQSRATKRNHAHPEQETPVTHAAPASGAAVYEEETPKDGNGCLGVGGFSCAPEERGTDELSIPSLGKLGLSSAAMEAIGDPRAPGSSPLWDNRSEDGDGGSDEDGDTRELYRQVISRQTPRAQPGTARARGAEAEQHPTLPTTPAAAAASVPTAAASARRSGWRPQSSIRKPLSNVNYSELALQRSAVKQQRSSSAAGGAAALAMQAVAREEFKAMPPFLTSRMTLEHLNAAVGSINEALRGKAASGLDEELSAADLEDLGLGARCQSVLGCLVRMDRMELGSADGRTVYRVVDA